MTSGIATFNFNLVSKLAVEVYHNTERNRALIFAESNFQTL